MDKIIIYTDGASRGNPGESASGFIVIKNGKIIANSEVYNGRATNNYAEYNAIIKALEWCIASIKDVKSIEVHIYSDSELVVRQLNNINKIKSGPLLMLNSKVKSLARLFGKVSFNNVRREDTHIMLVDHAINMLLDSIGKNSPISKKENY